MTPFRHSESLVVISFCKPHKLGDQTTKTYYSIVWFHGEMSLLQNLPLVSCTIYDRHIVCCIRSPTVGLFRNLYRWLPRWLDFDFANKSPLYDGKVSYLTHVTWCLEMYPDPWFRTFVLTRVNDSECHWVTPPNTKNGWRWGLRHRVSRTRGLPSIKVVPFRSQGYLIFDFDGDLEWHRNVVGSSTSVRTVFTNWD